MKDRVGLDFTNEEMGRMLKTYGRFVHFYTTGDSVTTSATTKSFSTVTKDHVFFPKYLDIRANVSAKFNIRFSPLAEWDDYNSTDGIADEFSTRAGVVAGGTFSRTYEYGDVFYGDGGSLKIQHQADTTTGLIEFGISGFEIHKDWLIRTKNNRRIITMVSDSRGWTVATKNILTHLCDAYNATEFKVLPCNKGKGGSTTLENRTIKEMWWGQVDASIVILMQGINDITASISAANTELNLIDQINFAKKSKTPHVFVVGEPTIDNATYNSGMAALRMAQQNACTIAGATYIPTDDLWTSGQVATYHGDAGVLIHPNSAGSLLIADRIREYITII